MWFIYGLAVVGAVVPACIVIGFAREVIRAGRQGWRIARVVRYLDRKRPSLSDWLRCSLKEVGSGYSTVRIGIFDIPHNPSERIRRAKL